MATQFIDSFDSYPNVSDSSNGLQSFWSVYNGFGNLFMSTPGRFGGQCVTAHGYTSGNNGQFTKGVTPTSTYSVGFSTRINTYIPGTINYLFHYSSCGIGIGLNSNQQYFVMQNNDPTQVLATAPNFISVGSWHYLELEVSIGSSGFVNLYVDGLLQASYSGNTGTGPNNYIGFGLFDAQDTSHSTEHSYDDVYVTDVATRYGERKVQILTVASDVAVQWTPSTGSTNYNLINTLPVPATPTTNVYAYAAGYQDLYTVTPLANSPSTVSCVQIRVCANKDNSATKTIATVIKSGSTEVIGTTYALTNSYLYYTNIYDQDPNTSGPWTKDTVNALEIGQRVIS
jgi:hypothetical protein